MIKRSEIGQNPCKKKVPFVGSLGVPLDCSVTTIVMKKQQKSNYTSSYYSSKMLNNKQSTIIGKTESILG